MMVLDIKLIPMQFDFTMDDSPWVLAFGGRGSTKTTGLCASAYIRACHPGAIEFMCRQKLIDFKTTTLVNLLEGVGGHPPVIPPSTYDHNQSTKTISIHNGGKIIYNGLDQGDVGRQMGSTGKGSSLNVSGAHFDECAEMEKAAVLQVCMGVRVKVPGLKLVRKFACNPGLPSSWVAEDWGLALDHVAKSGRVAYHLNPRDNWHLPDEYIHELESLDGIARDRYLDGKWVGSDGMVFDRFNRSVHVQARTCEWKKQILGIDDGYTDPFVILDIRQDTMGRYHIAREHYQTKMIQTEKIQRTKEMWNGSGDAYVDAAEPDMIESMTRAGIRAFAADKGHGSVMFGIGIIQTLLATMEDGVPMLTVDPNCVNTIREFESYEMEPGKDRPRDRDNHTCDSLRYALRADFEERGMRVVGGKLDLKKTVPAKDEPMDWNKWRNKNPHAGWN